MKAAATTGIALLGVLVAYLLLWPVAVEPQAWVPTKNPGYVGDFKANAEMAKADFISIPAGEYGPEDIAVGPDGRLYTAVHSGRILAVDPKSGAWELIADTGGRPLGIEFDAMGTLWVADAFIGLLSIDAGGVITKHADTTRDGSPILYADDVDIAPDGRVYFSDASTRFGARQIGDTLAASLLDLMEHSANGRVLVFDPVTQQTDVFADGLTFANGVAVSADGNSLLVNETGTYSVHRYSLLPDTYGKRETMIEGLPGFPDNINRMDDGTYWIGIVSPRSTAMDALANSPFLRKMVMRLPTPLRPAAQRYGFVIQIDDDGTVLANLQDPSGAYANTTGATVLPDGRLAISSLTEPRIALLRP